MSFGIVLGVASLAMSAVGTAVQYSAQKRAAGQAQAMANYNYALQTQQANMQASLAEQQASQNASLAEYQAGIQQRNADVLKLQATAVQNQYNTASEAEAKAGVHNVQNQREDARRFLALQRAKIGESGITGAGTPLDSLADAAGTLELQAQSIWHDSEVQSRKLTDIGNAQAYSLREQSTNEGLQAGMSLFEAANSRWQGQTAEAQQRLSIYGAESERLQGYNTSKNLKMASYGTLFSGLAQAGGSAYGMYNSGGLSGGHNISQSPYGY